MNRRGLLAAGLAGLVGVLASRSKRLLDPYPPTPTGSNPPGPNWVFLPADDTLSGLDLRQSQFLIDAIGALSKVPNDWRRGSLTLHPNGRWEILRDGSLQSSVVWSKSLDRWVESWYWGWPYGTKDGWAQPFDRYDRLIPR